MNNTISYRGYTGSVEISEEDEVFFGKVLGVQALISYEGATVQELVGDFRNAIDEYLDSCADEGVEPCVPYKGSFNVRVSPGLHEQMALLAIHEGKSLNSCVSEALEHYVAAIA